MILERLFERRASMENPSTPLTYPEDALGGGTSSSGVRINRTTALTYAPFWRGVNQICRDVAKLPLNTYERQGTGKRKAKEHPTYPLLRRKPNSEMTAFVFKQTLQSHALMHGNGYAYIFRRGDAAPLDLIPLSPEKTYPVRVNRQLLYYTEFEFEGTTATKVLLPENVLHIKGLGFDGLTGYSVIRMAANSLGLGMALQEYGSRYFRNNARPSVVIEHPNTMSEAAAKRLIESWNKMHQGLDNAHKAALLEEGAKVHAFSTNARDSQLLEQREYELIEAANWLLVPVHKVGGKGRTAYASLEQENRAYLDEAIDPWLVNWEEECGDKLLTEKEKDEETHLVEFNRDALLQADSATVSKILIDEVNNGLLLPDEARAIKNRSPLPAGLGQQFRKPENIGIVEPPVEDEEGVQSVDDLQSLALNGAQVDSLLKIAEMVVQEQLPADGAKALVKAAFPMLTDTQVEGIIKPLETFEPKPEEVPVPFGQAAPQPPPEPSGDDGEEDESDTAEPADERTARLAAALRAGVVRAAKRMVRRIGTHATRCAKKPHGFGQWLDEFGDEHRAALLDELDHCVAACSVLSGESVSVISLVDDLLEQLRTGLLEESGRHQADTLPEGIEQCMATYESSMPEQLADSLLGKVVGNGA